jgi:hypothetical protein
VPYFDEEAMREWDLVNQAADELGVPEQWVVCPLCGKQAWRLPPHGYAEPCPIVVDMAEAAGLKFDAERNAMIRVGQQMEQMGETVRKHLDPDEED